MKFLPRHPGQWMNNRFERRQSEKFRIGFKYSNFPGDHLPGPRAPAPLDFARNSTSQSQTTLSLWSRAPPFTEMGFRSHIGPCLSPLPCGPVRKALVPGADDGDGGRSRDLRPGFNQSLVKPPSLNDLVRPVFQRPPHRISAPPGKQRANGSKYVVFYHIWFSNLPREVVTIREAFGGLVGNFQGILSDESCHPRSW